MVSFEFIVIISSWLDLYASFMYYDLAVRGQNRVRVVQLRLD